jgi:hypothetical protein
MVAPAAQSLHRHKCVASRANRFFALGVKATPFRGNCEGGYLTVGDGTCSGTGRSRYARRPGSTPIATVF